MTRKVFLTYTSYVYSYIYIYMYAYNICPDTYIYMFVYPRMYIQVFSKAEVGRLQTVSLFPVDFP